MTTSTRQRRIAIPTVVASLLLAGFLVGSGPANSVTTRLTINPGISNCPAGYVCLWLLSDFQGTGYAFYNTETNYANLPAPFNGINDNSWSFYNHGNNSDIRFYRETDWGDSIVLCKGDWISVIPSNSEVWPAPNSGEPGRGWRDQVSSHRFGAYC